MGIFSKTALEEEPKLEEEKPDPFETLLQPPQPVGTVIAQGMTLTGNLKGEGDVLVEGKLAGEIESAGAVTIASTGEVEGPIVADNIRIGGRLKGNVTARTQLRLECMGSVDGDISAASLIVENGSSFNGRSTMLPPSAGKQAKAPQPSRNEKADASKSDKY